MVDWRLAIFPSNGLDRSLHAPIWVGLVVTTFFTEAFGWTYAGLVVPGYMGAVLAAAPVTALLIAVEAVLTYLLVAGVGQWLTVSGAWSTAFGRERFFLFIVGSMVVRVFMEGFIVPHVVAHYSLAHSRELYSVGLVLVPLFANVFWSSGILSAGPRLVVVTLIVYAFVELVLVRHTNFSVSRLLIANESGAQKFLASPKLEIILLLGALIGAQGNVRYGWDYNGILVPALLGVAWYEPTKFASTLVEAVAVYGLSRAVVTLPPFSRLLIVGTRRMLVAFTVGFLAKIVIGFTVSRFAPRVQLVDYLGYGYLLPSLLAVKMWNKDKIGVVLMPTVLVSMAAFVAGNGVGVVASWVSAATSESPAYASAPIVSADDAGIELMRADAFPDPHKGYAESGGRSPVAITLTFARDLREHGHVDDDTLREVARDAMSARVARGTRSDWMVLGPRASDPDARDPRPRIALRARGPSSSWMVVVKAPAPGSPLLPIANRLAEDLDASGIVVVSRYPEVGQTDRDVARRLGAALDATNVLVIADGPRGRGASLSIVGMLPGGLDPVSLGKTLGREVDLGWRAPAEDARDGLLADAALLQVDAETAEAAAMAFYGPIERPVWSGSVHDELRARLVGLTSLGSAGFDSPTVEELRLFGSTVLEDATGWSSDGPRDYTRFLAARLGFDIVRIGGDEGPPEAWALVESGGPQGRRGRPTLVVYADKDRADTLVEVPAPRWEVGTFLGALATLNNVSARGLLIAGAMPHEGALGVADARRMDGRRSFYQRIHEKWLESGGDALSVQGISADRAPDEDAVLSFGRELSSSALEPTWASPVRSALESGGNQVAAFDGSRAHASFGGAGDPTMAFAERFARDAYAILWLGPHLRAQLAAIESRDRGQRALAEARGLASEDVAERALQAAATPSDGPCDLDGLRVAWEKYTREENPFELKRLLGGSTHCHSALVADRGSRRVWAVLHGGGGGRAWAVPLGIPVTRQTPPLEELGRVRAAVAWGIASVHVGGTP